MNSHLINIVVWNGKAYLPTIALRKDIGLWVWVGPVYAAELNTKDLATVIEKLKAAGHKQIPSMTKEDLEKLKTMLEATGAKNWKELGRLGLFYSIEWTGKEVRVDMSYPAKKGGWLNDPQKARLFPRDTSLETILTVIFDDIRSYPQFKPFMENP